MNIIKPTEVTKKKDLKFREQVALLKSLLSAEDFADMISIDETKVKPNRLTINGGKFFITKRVSKTNKFLKDHSITFEQFVMILRPRMLQALLSNMQEKVAILNKLTNKEL